MYVLLSNNKTTFSSTYKMGVVHLIACMGVHACHEYACVCVNILFDRPVVRLSVIIRSIKYHRFQVVILLNWPSGSKSVLCVSAQ